MRKGDTPDDSVVVVFNMTPVPRHNYKVGVPFEGVWQEVLNSDSQYYGGKGMGNMGSINATKKPIHGHAHSVSLQAGGPAPEGGPALYILTAIPNHLPSV